MTTRHKGLGRGLDALLGGNNAKAGKAGDEELAQLAITQLKPGKYQPRTRMDESSLQELSESIKVRGVIQPIVVRPVGDSQYEILAGERRWRAARMAGLQSVPAVNIQREDLNPLEEALGLQRLIREFQLTHDEVAKAIGRSRTGVTNLLRLLELAAPVQAMLQDGKIDMGHARALLGLSGARQLEVANQVATQGLSVRETERLVQQATAAPAARRTAPKLDPDSRRLQEELAESLGASVELKPRANGRGSVVIDYSSLDELQGLVKRLLKR
jgi:ParB family chromosome partitioning protein